MTKQEFQLAFALAQSNADLSEVDQEPIFGYGLPEFGRKTLPLSVIAACIRWQALKFNGEWDGEELDTMRILFREKIEVAELTDINEINMLIRGLENRKEFLESLAETPNPRS